ncbi:hypothetical protein KI387_027046, partial [Taxus chinensis]
KEIEYMVDHSGNELESPNVEFYFDPTLLDEFIFKNKDRVLAWVLELGAKMPTESETIPPANNANEEERALTNIEDILMHGHASTSNTGNNKIVGHRIPFIKVPHKNMKGHENGKGHTKNEEEEEPLKEETTI